MKFFSAALLVTALVAGLVDASPTKTFPLEARGGGGGGGGGGKKSSSSCGQNEFWYEKRSCCLKDGGPTGTPKPPSGVDCPESYYFHYGEGCCVPRHKPTHTATPTCSKNGWSWFPNLQCCSEEGGTTTPGPTPSSKPKGRDKSGGWGNYDGKGKGEGKGKDKSKIKRNLEQWDVSFCPTGLTTCPIASNGILTGDSECIDTTVDLVSCGGCASLGEGTDCSTIPGASCLGGVCVV